MRQRLFLIALVAGALTLVPAQLARAQVGVADTCTTPTTGTNTAPNQPCWVAGIYTGDYSGTNDTQYYTQAGGHPFTAVTDFTVANSSGVPDANVTNARVDVPPGLISNPQATPKCTSAQFPSCPANTQLGVVRLELYTLGSDEWFGASVYNVVPPAGKVSDYAFNIPLVNVRTDIIGGIRSGAEQFSGVPNVAADDGLYFTIAVPSSSVPAEIVRSTLVFWGVPGDSAHTPDAGWSCDPVTDAVTNPSCNPPASGASSPAGTPFLTLPSGCVPPGQVTTLTLTDSTGDQGQAMSTTPVAGTGCGSVAFNPTLTLTPDTTQADAPTGLKVDLHVPQNQDPSGLATSTVQTAAVTLPPGMTLDPSGANGLAACSPGQFAYGSDAPPSCPAGSQVGTARIDTPLLPDRLTGSVYLGCDGSSAQTPCTPVTPGGPIAARLYVYLTAPAEGLVQKLIGTVATDSATGQVTTTFANQPQVPFTDFTLDLNGGPTATVANPLACGPATTSTSVAPYSGNAAAAPTSTFTVDDNGSGAPCPTPTPFSHSLSVSSGTLQAGAFDQPFSVTVSRPDREQYLSRIAASLPPGLVGVLASVPECPDPQAGQGDCSAASRIGSTTVQAGSGSDPITQTGEVFLTGPYAGAPFGLTIVIPAIAGPFDLGTVVVRSAISVDRNDAHVTVTSDPLPQIVGGVPLRLRSVALTIDRPNFMLNPTSCDPLEIAATLTSVGGATAAPAAPLQAAGCESLAFAPGLHIALAGNDQTTVGHHPALTATLTSSLGQASVRSASVTLPLSLALDPTNSAHVCSVPASQADACPADTAIGSASLTTPVLSQPLTGTVYLVQGIRTGANGEQIRTLPALLIPLRGQVAIDLRGQTSVDSRSRLVTTFPAVPDAPVSSFVMKISGGPRGILVVTGHANLCRGRQLALAALAGHNGGASNQTVAMSVPCLQRVTVKRVLVVGNRVRVSVAVPAAGSLRVIGAGFAKAGKTVRRAGLVRLTLRLSTRGRAKLRRHGRVVTRLTVVYRPAAGWPTQANTTRSVSIRR